MGIVSVLKKKKKKLNICNDTQKKLLNKKEKKVKSGEIAVTLEENKMKTFQKEAK